MYLVRVPLVVAVLSAAYVLPAFTFGEEVWSVKSGTTTLAIHGATLDGVGITAMREDRSTNWAAAIQMAVDDESNLRLSATDGVLRDVAAGFVRHSEGLILETAAACVHLAGFTLATSDGSLGRFVITDAVTGIALLEIRELKVGFDQIGGELLLEGAELAITPALADLLGDRRLAGVVVGAMSMQAQIAWYGGDQPAAMQTPSVGDLDTVTDEGGVSGGNQGTVCPRPVGPDVIVGDILPMCNYTAVGSVEGFAVGTTSCNIGNQNLLWNAGNNEHPVIGQNMFRLKNGRFEHIGQSWLKHGFTALEENICGCTCNGDGGSVLGVGCSDPYVCSLNAQQTNLGPKSDVNAYTGGYPYPYTIGWQQSGSSIYKRLQVRISDLDPAQDGGGQYFVEGQYVTADDAAFGNHFNNASYRAVTITGGGTAWTATNTGATQREQPGIRAWKDTDNTVTETDARVANEGLFIVSSKATDIGGGFWHYEYAVQNLNSHRAGQSFSVPISPFATVQNIGFHDVDYHSGVPYSLTDWTPAWIPGSVQVSWSTETVGANPSANALRWGTLYNFRFDANVPPTSSEATIGLFQSGTPASTTAAVQGPEVGPPDCNGNLIDDACDISCGVPAGPCDVPNCGLSVDCDMNGVPDECEPDCNNNDIVDACDISSTFSLDCNENQIPDECETLPTTPLTTVQVASGLDSPLYACAPPADTTRLFIVEQGGLIKILEFGTGIVLPTPFLNVSGLISSGGELGLLGMAFHPDYANNGFFYINYTNPAQSTVIARYTVSGNPNVANAGSAVILKTIAQPFSNHNGGCLQFGPDNMLYVGMGDGGSANDPGNRAQNTGMLLGKMLRLDADNPPTYVPADNPFVGPGNPLDEIWAIGMRNPWRFSFDRRTGDMYIGDVGQDAREEIDFEPAGISGGRNYGWRCMEGFLCTGLSGCTCNSPALTLPIIDVPHVAGCNSISGGYVYRGCGIPDLSGTYFYADYCRDYIRSFRYNGSVTNHQDRTGELGSIVAPVSFGEDANGELYVVSYFGSVYRIMPDVGPICGNNLIEAGEQCDDGNTSSGDGCDSTCQIEIGNNDGCGNAAIVCNGTHSGSTATASVDGSASCGVSGSTADVWYQYTPDLDGTLTLSTCTGSGYDTVLSIHSGCPGTSANELACNDNGCAGDKSQLSLPVLADTPYYIRVSGANKAIGAFNLTIVGPGCSDCPNVLFEDHFETDLGWTVQNVGSFPPGDGAWVRAIPSGGSNGDDPADDYDHGGRCYVTDNAAGNSDVDFGPTRLISPVIDLSNGGVTLRYAYWFTRDDLEGDDRLDVEVTTNGTDWVLLASHTVNQPFWRLNTIWLDAFVTPSATTRIRFSTLDNPNNSVVEAAVDAVLLTTPCFDDCNNNGTDDLNDIGGGTSQDCNGNTTPDECDIRTGASDDCDGGPVGVESGGATIFGGICLNCHDADGTGGKGFPGPNIRNYSRVQIWEMLLPPTTHPGGAHPEFEDQDFADIEAFLADAGSRGRPDRVPDECQALVDCDTDLASDGCELETGSQSDVNYDGHPDDCVPLVCNPPASASAVGSRAIAIAPAAGTDTVALRVTGDPLDPAKACISLYVQADGTLDVGPVFQTPAAWGATLLADAEILPNSLYSVATDCGFGSSASLGVTTWLWGDGNNSGGSVDLTDIECVLNGFGGDFQVCTITAVDVAPCVPDGLIDIDDITAVLDAFSGAAQPCPDPCP